MKIQDLNGQIRISFDPAATGTDFTYTTSADGNIHVVLNGSDYNKAQEHLRNSLIKDYSKQILSADGQVLQVDDWDAKKSLVEEEASEEIPWADRKDEPNNVKENLAKERKHYCDLSEELLEKISEAEKQVEKAKKAKNAFKKKFKEASELADDLRAELKTIERIDKRLDTLADDFSQEFDDTPLA